MRQILVDTSIWIDFFRGNSVAEPLQGFIESNQIVTNDLILSELLPSIDFRREKRLRQLLLAITKIELEIDWQAIVGMQTKNLESGQNHIGIPDLVVAQNALQNGLVLFENDKHFVTLNKLFGLNLLRGQFH